MNIMGPGGNHYPVIPGAPNCRHFMKTRSCGFGMTCRFNHPLPEREGQPDCGFYMKTGRCKFGESCKFNHPPEAAKKFAEGASGPSGPGGALGDRFGAGTPGSFPSRPGEAACKFFMKTGSCSYGPTCRFDHPKLAEQPEVTAAATNGHATEEASVAVAESLAVQPVPVEAASA